MSVVFSCSNRYRRSLDVELFIWIFRIFYQFIKFIIDLVLGLVTTLGCGLTYKFYNCFATLIQYIKDYNIVAESLYSEAFAKVLLRYLNKDFKKDWIGRLYAVINPNIDINGKLNFNNTVIVVSHDSTDIEGHPHKACMSML
mgnify:CR=1 FL=1